MAEAQFDSEIMQSADSKRLIADRREAEQELMIQGCVGFEALKSNGGFLPNKPEVSTHSSSEKGVIEDDRVVSQGLMQELEKHDLQPNGHIFYLIDFGLPHLPALQSVLLDYGIDPSIYTSPSEEVVSKSAGHFERYVSVYRELADELFAKREKLAEQPAPLGYALLVNSHAEQDEVSRITAVLPTIETLRQQGITKVVLGKEFYYGDRVGDTPDPRNLSWRSFFESPGANKYIKELSDAGIDVIVIGFDYRIKYRQHTEDNYNGYGILKRGVGFDTELLGPLEMASQLGTITLSITAPQSPRKALRYDPDDRELGN